MNGSVRFKTDNLDFSNDDLLGDAGPPAASAASGNQSSDVMVLKLLRGRSGEKISGNEICDELVITPEQLAESINNLSSQKLIEILADAHNNVFYKAVDREAHEIMQQLNQEECMVYQRIKDCGNMGIWVRHLSRDTNLPAPKIAQCIKTLELRSIIKLVKNVKYPARKTYMLANIQPSVELTGGAFYTDDDLDEEFIQQLANYAYNIVLQYSFPPTTSSRSGINTGAYDKLAVFGPGLARYPTAADVHRKIINSGIVANPDDLATDDIRSILEMLVFDGRLERLMPDPSMAVRNGAGSGGSRKLNMDNFGDNDDGDDGEVWGLSTAKSAKRNATTGKGKQGGAPGDKDKKPKVNYMYRALRSTAAIGRRSITEMPCGKCPVYSKCGDDSLVSPVTCEYMANWLELEY